LYSEFLATDVPCEVIVTDDSKTNMAQMLIAEHFSWVTWVNGPKQGPAANRNNGAKVAKGEWLIFLDDDCLPQSGWLGAYIKAITTAGDALVFEGCTDAERHKERFDEEAPINTTGDKLWSCNFAINKQFFGSINGFDETFPYAAMEDIDFYVRVKEVTSLKFIKDAFVIHPWRRIKPFSTFKKHIRSHRHFAKKYNQLGTTAFRINRAKIFAGSVFVNLKTLIGFSMKGSLVYLEKCLINFCLIFI
jgi:GT2 family glycosyltransferase